MKNRIPLLSLITLLSLMFPLAVFADVISGPEIIIDGLSQISPAKILSLVAALVIGTTALIRNRVRRK